MVYRWKSGTRYSSSLAQTAGEVCDELEKKGELTPSNLVDVSRPEEAPLHKCFEWDDAKAAESYRKNQAMHLIRSIEIVSETNPKVSEPMFYHIRVNDDDAKYENINVIIRHEDKMQSLLADAYRDMKSFTEKYRKLERLSKVVEAMDEELSNEEAS